MQDLDRFLALWVKQARADVQDSRDAGVVLLRRFVEAQANDVDQLLISYLQDCVKAWLGSDCNPRAAPKSFHVEQPSHRPHDPRIRLKHIRAIRCYHLLRGRGKGRDDAIVCAAKCANVSERTIKKLLAEIDAAPMGFDEEASPTQLINASVLAVIGARSQKVLARCLNPPRKRYQLSR